MTKIVFGKMSKNVQSLELLMENIWVKVKGLNRTLSVPLLH